MVSVSSINWNTRTAAACRLVVSDQSVNSVEDFSNTRFASEG